MTACRRHDTQRARSEIFKLSLNLKPRRAGPGLPLAVERELECTVTPSRHWTREIGRDTDAPEALSTEGAGHIAANLKGGRLGPRLRVRGSGASLVGSGGGGGLKFAQIGEALKPRRPRNAFPIPTRG